MLTSQSEKWLHQEFEDDRCDALEDSSGFTDAELLDLEVTRTQGGGVNDPETYLVDSVPVDPESEVRADAVDIRAIPGHD